MPTKTKPSLNGSSASANGTQAQVKVAKSVAPLQIDPIRFETISVPVIGITPLIQNKFSNKAMQMMLDKQMGKTKLKKPPKDPEELYQSSMHRLEDGGYGHPVTAFKAATVDAARFYDGVTFEDLKRCLFFIGEPELDGNEQLVRLNAEPTMDEAHVRNETGVADIRYRAKFSPWSGVVTVRFNSIKLSAEAVVNLIDAGGQSSGIGEGRPSAPKSRNGSSGTYAVYAGGQIVTTNGDA